MSIIRLSRRVFLAAAGAMAASSLLGCGGGGGDLTPIDPVDAVDKTTMWRLAAGGRKVSNAAKRHNANMRFATRAAALAGRAHPGDPSFPVPLDARIDVWEHAFSDGRVAVDLRKTSLS